MTTTLRPVVAHGDADLPALVDAAVVALRQLGDALEQYRRQMAVPVAPVAHAVDDSPLRTHEVAEVMGVGYRTVARLIRLGDLHAVKAGKYWLVTRAEIQRFLAGARRSA